jgi:hypothetical protein
MQAILEDLLVSIVKKLLTEDVIKGSEKKAVDWLASLVKDKDPSLLPLVEMVALALGVPYTSP